ncbi:TIM barrel protein [Burkholderia sp. GS2Y]|uniref:3-dehydroshikimate dehydratase n=2 Tax=Burkholderia theae TaxID=3143496 RepID=A0ABU9WJM1_9BURK
MRAVSAAGFDGIELFESDFVNFNGSATSVRAMAADFGLSIDLYQPFRDFEGMPDALYRRNLERAERKFDLMQALGVPTMLCCSNTSPAIIDDTVRAAAQLHELADRAAKRGLKVGFEALAWGRVTNLFRQAWELVQLADHPNLGLILDSFHTLSLKDDPTGISVIPGDKIFFLQMADAPILAMDVLQWARHYRSFPGQGQFDLVNFLEQVLLAGYTGPLSLEIFNDVFRETSTKRIALDAMRSLLYLESQVGRRLRAETEYEHWHGRSRQVKRALTNKLFDPPPVPALNGVSFLEFAVDERSAAVLDTMLSRMGFRRIGRHRSRSIDLYGQGGICFVVNAQPGSYARERVDEFGAGVCAIGLGTDDPDRAFRRAMAMNSRQHGDGVGANRSIPTVVSPGGNLIAFVSTNAGQTEMFEDDFDMEDASDLAETGCDCGLTAIDHVALGLASDHLDSWVLFARSILGLEPGESQELADPFGLVRSRGVANAERSLRFVFSVSLSQRTSIARTVRVGGSAAVHHIALNCNDIFETVEQLRRNGLRFVPVSDNYYDDLQARIDVDVDLLARMRRLGLLLDRSPAGDFFHVYTESFEDGLFFEIVQRAHGYDAYGATNAPARMAAQVGSES